MALGLAPAAYGFAEAHLYRRRSYTIPVLPPGATPLRILQISDLHLRPANRAMRRFLESLGTAEYDMVMATGDLLGGPEVVQDCLKLLNALQGRFARLFVFGSSDYFAPVLKNYLDYFYKRRRHGSSLNPSGRFRQGLADAGWHDMNNAELRLDVAGTSIHITGLDDPYLHREDLRLLKRRAGADLALVMVHDPAPYLQALQAGYDLVIGGHTHGGQVRLPWSGAVVTNSTLPPRLAMGLHHLDEGWLFVTPGLGTGKYAPFRLLCPPEASVLDLVPRIDS